jgi:hypothetical protein
MFGIRRYAPLFPWLITTVNNQNTNGSQKEDPAEVQIADALKVSEVPENVSDDSSTPLLSTAEAARALVSIRAVPDPEPMPSPGSPESSTPSDPPQPQSSTPPATYGMSKILVYFEVAPQHQSDSSRVHPEASGPSQSLHELHPVPLLAMSKPAVIFEKVPQPQTMPSLEVPRETVPLGVEHESTIALSSSTTATHSTSAKSPTPPFEAHEQLKADCYHPLEASGNTMIKDTAGPGLNARTTIQDRSQLESLVGQSSQSHDDRIKNGRIPEHLGLRLIDFDELVKTAASAKNPRPSDRNSMDKLLDGEEMPHSVPEATSSMEDVMSTDPPGLAMTSKSSDTRGPLPGLSTACGRINTQKPIPRSGTREKPIVLDDLIDDDDRMTWLRDIDSDLDLMQHALRRNAQGDIEDLNKNIQMIDDQWPMSTTGYQRSSPRRSRAATQHPGMIRWKPAVEGLLDKAADTWTNVQTTWMLLYNKRIMRERGSIQRFQERMCEAEETFRTQRIRASDAEKLVCTWSIIHRIIYPALERREEKELMKKFQKELRKFYKISQPLQDQDPTLGDDMEGDDEDDMDWTPDMERRRT